MTASQDDKDAYVTLTSGLGPESLLVPQAQKATLTPESIVLVEVVVDLNSVEGRTFAAEFIAAMEAMPESLGSNDEMSLAYRILPNNASSASSILCPVLARASKFDAEVLIESLKSNDLKMNEDELSQDACLNLPYFENELPSALFIIANGRVFAPEDGILNKEDVELLINLEKGKAKGVTKLLLSDLTFDNNEQYDAVSQASSFLAEQQSENQRKRSDMESMVVNMEKALDVESNPLRFSWNDVKENDGLLKVRSSKYAFVIFLIVSYSRLLSSFFIDRFECQLLSIQ